MSTTLQREAKQRYRNLQRTWTRFDRSTALFAKERFNREVMEENWRVHWAALEEHEAWLRANWAQLHPESSSI